jgi:hypothetical protein
MSIEIVGFYSCMLNNHCHALYIALVNEEIEQYNDLFVGYFMTLQHLLSSIIGVTNERMMK